MAREVVTVSWGQAGVQLGDAYCAEHGLLADDKSSNINTSYDGLFRGFFEEINGGLLVPRNLSVELDPNVINDIRNDSLSNLLIGKERHNIVGKEIIDDVNDSMRKLLENCDNVPRCSLNHIVGGGTGSSLVALISQQMAAQYRKKSDLGCVIKTYDASSMTASSRFKGEVNVDFNQFQSNLVSLWRLHFTTPLRARVLTPVETVKSISGIFVEPRCFVKLSSVQG